MRMQYPNRAATWRMYFRRLLRGGAAQQLTGSSQAVAGAARPYHQCTPPGFPPAIPVASKHAA